MLVVLVGFSAISEGCFILGLFLLAKDAEVVPESEKELSLTRACMEAISIFRCPIFDCNRGRGGGGVMATPNIVDISPTGKKDWVPTNSFLRNEGE